MACIAFLSGIVDGEIIVPSSAARATARDANLVFWKWAAVPPHKVVVIDDERRLPRNQGSWKTPS